MLAKRFPFIVVVVVLHTLVKIGHIAVCSFAVPIFSLLLFLLPFVVNKDVQYKSNARLSQSIMKV